MVICISNAVSRAKILLTKNPLVAEGIFVWLFAAVVAANVAAAAAAKNEKKGKNVAKTPHSVAAATAQKNENQKDAFTAASATRVAVCKKVHDMYLLEF